MDSFEKGFLIGFIAVLVAIVLMFGIYNYHIGHMASQGYEQVMVLGNSSPVWQKVK